MAGPNGAVDQQARDLATAACGEIRAHVHMWERAEEARDRRDADFREQVNDWLRRIQKSYEEGQTRQESLHALSVGDIRADLVSLGKKLDDHESDDKGKFRGLYNRFYASSVALNTVLLAVCAYLIQHKGL